MATTMPATPVLDEELPATIVALFDDPIDAQNALQALRKRELAATGVSLLVRHGESDDDSVVNVARDLVAAALGAMATWLTNLAELIVTEQGRFLVAGPMGAALTGAGRPRTARPERPADVDQLHWVLTEFGFAVAEVDYVAQRLAAGTTLLAISTHEQQELANAREVFHSQDAVFVSMAPTDAAFLTTLGSSLREAPPAADDVVVADMIAPIHEAAAASEWHALRGREARHANGDEAGTVERILVYDAPESTLGTGPPRYLVLTFGGMLRLGRKHVIVPAALADLVSDPLSIAINRDQLHAAPPYDDAVPLTRRDEERIHRHVGLTPYWEAAVTTSTTEGEPNG